MHPPLLPLLCVTKQFSLAMHCLASHTGRRHGYPRVVVLHDMSDADWGASITSRSRGDNIAARRNWEACAIAASTGRGTKHASPPPFPTAKPGKPPSRVTTQSFGPLWFHPPSHGLHTAFLAQSHQAPDEPNHLQIFWKEGAVHYSAGCINETISLTKNWVATFFLHRITVYKIFFAKWM
jgi:hypothetical protein